MLRSPSFQFVNSYKRETLRIVLDNLEWIAFDEKSAMKFLSTCFEDASLGNRLKAELYYLLALIKPQKDGKLGKVNIIQRHDWMQQASLLLGSDPAGEPQLRSRVLSDLKVAQIQKQLLITLKDRLWMLGSSFQLPRTEDEDGNLLLVTSFEEWDTRKLVQSYIQNLTGERAAFGGDLISLYQEVAFRCLPLKRLQELSSQFAIFEIQVIIEIGAKSQNARLTPESLLQATIGSFLKQTGLTNKTLALMPSRHQDELAILKSIVANYIIFHPTRSSNFDQTTGTGELPFGQVLEDIERASSSINSRATARPTAYDMLHRSQDHQPELWWAPKLLIGSQPAKTLPIVCKAYLNLARHLENRTHEFKADLEMVIKVACTLLRLSSRSDLTDPIRHQSSQHLGSGFVNTTYGSTSQLAKDPTFLKAEMRDCGYRLLKRVEEHNSNRTRNEMIPEALQPLDDIVNQTTQSQTETPAQTRVRSRHSHSLVDNMPVSMKPFQAKTFF